LAAGNTKGSVNIRVKGPDLSGYGESWGVGFYAVVDQPGRNTIAHPLGMGDVIKVEPVAAR
jgi:hypothetical protein